MSTNANMHKSNANKTKNEVEVFMEQQKLEQYTKVLLNLGYDDLEVLKALSKTEIESVTKLTLMKPGHAAKFAWALAQTKEPKTAAAAAEPKSDKTAPKEGKPEASLPQCPAGHDLVTFRTPLVTLNTLFKSGSNFTCDVCKNRIAKYAVAHGCRECNYDVCDACYTKKYGSSGGAYVAMIVDRSGSMRSMGVEVMKGFNTFLKEQKALPGKCSATVVRFDNEVEVLQHGVELQSVRAATHDTFKPRGSTALIDAMGGTIEMVEKQVKSMEPRPDKVMVMILTDGAENASNKFTRESVMANIKRLETTGSWQFVFVGANQDAIKVGQTYGMSAQNCLSYSATPEYQNQTFQCLSANAATYRGGCKSSYSGFTPAQRSYAKA